jgi:hypothetical protein
MSEPHKNNHLTNVRFPKVTDRRAYDAATTTDAAI